MLKMRKVKIIEMINCGYHGLITIDDCKACEVYDGRDNDHIKCITDET